MLEKFDQQLFLFLNSINSPFWDHIMFAISGILIWIPLYLVILYFTGKKYNRKFWVVLIVIALAVTFADQSSVFLKNLTLRPRPCHEPALEGLVHIVNGKCGGMFSFVSSHAANTFCVAMISSLLLKERWFSIFIFLWAFIVSYSRIYLGLHYPGDMLCGSILGLLIGWGMYSFYTIVDTRILQYKPYFNQSGNKTLWS